eukprot:scaffold3058_cov232-Pinguiococcus_pyrenoidosus.AAC.3
MARIPASRLLTTLPYHLSKNHNNKQSAGQVKSPFWRVCIASAALWESAAVRRHAALPIAFPAVRGLLAGWRPAGRVRSGHPGPHSGARPKAPNYREPREERSAPLRSGGDWRRPRRR